MRRLTAGLMVAIVAFTAPGYVFAQDETEAPEPKPVTTKNIDIPVEELKLLVKPMTVEELEVEAKAWFKLLRAKAREIAAAQVGVRRTNEAIDAAEEKGGEAAADAVREAAQVVQEAADQTKQEQAEAGAEEQPDEEVEVAAATDADAAAVAEEEKPKDTAEAAEKVAAGAEMVAASANAEDVQAVVSDAKLNLLENTTERRAEQVELVDRLNVVLDSLERKGGDVESYRKYVSAISGIEVDVTDTMAAWATVKGWLLSDEGGQRWFWNLVQLGGVLFGTWLVALVVGGMFRQVMSRSGNRMSKLAKDAIVKAVKTAIWVVGIVIGISMLEIDITPMLAAIGAAGLVIGLALQGTLSNVASGVMILANRPFDVGDVVNAGGVLGTISEMSLVATIFRTFDNQTVIVPNNEIWGHVITNITANPTRRVDLMFGISYSDDIAKAEKIITEVVESHEKVLKDPEPVIKMHELGDSSVNIVCRPWCKGEDYWAVYWDIIRSVKDRFDAEGISIPFPQRDVHVHYVHENGSKDKSGDTWHKPSEAPKGKQAYEPAEKD